VITEVSLLVIASDSEGMACADPERPRMSLDTSGLRFCGMIDEPVVNSAASDTNANSWL